MSHFKAKMHQIPIPGFCPSVRSFQTPSKRRADGRPSLRWSLTHTINGSCTNLLFVTYILRLSKSCDVYVYFFLATASNFALLAINCPHTTGFTFYRDNRVILPQSRHHVSQVNL